MTSRSHSFRGPARALFLAAHAFSASALAPRATHSAYLAVTTLAALSWASISWLTSSPSSQPPLSQAPFSRFSVTFALMLTVLFFAAPILTAPPHTYHSRDLVLAALLPMAPTLAVTTLTMTTLAVTVSWPPLVLSVLAAPVWWPLYQHSCGPRSRDSRSPTLCHGSRLREHRTHGFPSRLLPSPHSRGFVSCDPHPRGARSRPHLRISCPAALVLAPFLAARALMATIIASQILVLASQPPFSPPSSRRFHSPGPTLAASLS
ncbi:hypothetical protein BOTBODRAFT_170970 [Botryobasidium botryosum FD-172 SS1]|uniref:Uncharacterized protein n=1 Tax=Botryobasidium botryosum (strain FD-172 SS1) TaxID=930990 RepID=A0A067MWB5_BOTB1|nr:hypothetical protein BOTBODRAFT_170970 [Botryobasidium botryosum FD-172 SS1]